MNQCLCESVDRHHSTALLSANPVHCVSSPQVNGVSLIGESHKEVVRILKELPLCVYMACCRPAPVPQTHVDAAGQSDVLSTDSLVKVLWW